MILIAVTIKNGSLYSVTNGNNPRGVKKSAEILKNGAKINKIKKLGKNS